MLPEKLDLLFPVIVMVYGAVMTLVLHAKPFSELAETRLPYAVSQQMKAHRGLGLFCLVIGGFWSLQNLWF
jgi:hypothetical protein